MSVVCPFCGNETDVMTTGQVASLLGVAKKTVLGWVRAGRFPGAIKSSTGVQPESWRIPTSAVLPLAQERASR